jgi:hypothetical protein
MIPETLSGDKSIAGEDIECSRMPEEVEITSVGKFRGFCMGGRAAVELVPGTIIA